MCPGVVKIRRHRLPQIYPSTLPYVPISIRIVRTFMVVCRMSDGRSCRQSQIPLFPPRFCFSSFRLPICQAASCSAALPLLSPPLRFSLGKFQLTLPATSTLPFSPSSPPPAINASSVMRRRFDNLISSVRRLASHVSPIQIGVTQLNCRQFMRPLQDFLSSFHHVK